MEVWIRQTEEYPAQEDGEGGFSWGLWDRANMSSTSLEPSLVRWPPGQRGPGPSWADTTDLPPTPPKQNYSTGIRTLVWSEA